MPPMIQVTTWVELDVALSPTPRAASVLQREVDRITSTVTTVTTPDDEEGTPPPRG
jgi:hypothetical protein